MNYEEVSNFSRGLGKYIYEEIILLFELRVKKNPNLLKQNPHQTKLIKYKKMDEIKNETYIEENTVYFKADKANYYTSILSHFRNSFAHGNFEVVKEKNRIKFKMIDINKYRKITMKCTIEKKYLEDFISEVEKRSK